MSPEFLTIISYEYTCLAKKGRKKEAQGDMWDCFKNLLDFFFQYMGSVACEKKKTCYGEKCFSTKFVIWTSLLSESSTII